MPSAKLCTSLLTCIVLLGCGSRSSPAAPASEHDSTLSTAGPALPAPGADAVTAGAAIPAGSVPVAPAGESIPVIITRAFPAAGSVRSVSRPFPHRVIRDSGGALLGYEAYSDSGGVTAPGYGGMVPVQVFFDSRGRAVRIYVLDNSETPAYMDLVLRSGLLDSLLVCDPAKPDSVDAVTLATASSRAIISGVTGLATRVATEIVATPGSRSR